MSSSEEEKALLYGDISTLVKVTLEGEIYEVPEGLELLRCYQFLDFNIQFENFCWNGNCENCAAMVGLGQDAPKETLCCQEPAAEGLCVEKLPEGVEKPS